MSKTRQIQKKLVRLMKLSFLNLSIVIIFAGASLAHELTAQELLNRKVTLRVNKSALTEVLTNIENQTGVTFTYRPKLVNLRERFTFVAVSEPLGEVLTRLLTPLQIKYKVISDKVILSPLSMSAEDPRESDGVQTHLIASPDVTVSGTVVDEKGEPLPGVSILIKGTQQGMITDSNGKFSLDVPDENSVLVFSFVGYLSQEVAVGKRTSLDVSLKVDQKALEEVVVVGYGIQKREEIIGSVAQVTSDQLSSRPVSNLNQALAGQVPGLTITQSSGRPGMDQGTIRLRGIGSFGASPDVMVIIDGIPSNLATMSNLDPNSIESVSVLKDASSAAIYGARAANGVIVITTKTGVEGRPRVTYSGYVGMQTPTALPEFLDSWDFAKAYNEAAGSEVYTAEEIQKYREGSDPDYFPNTKFLRDIVRNNTQTSHSLGISGGSASNRYNLSLGYFNQNGLVERNRFERFNVRLNMITEISKRITLTSRLAMISRTRREPGNNVTTILDEAVRAPNFYVGVYSNGNFGEGMTNIGTPFSRLARRAFVRDNEQHINGNFRLDYKPAEGLQLSFLTSYIQENSLTKSFLGTQTIGIDNQFLLAPSTLRDQSSVDRNYTLQGLGSYNKRFGKHHFSALLGYSFEAYTASNINAFRDNFPGNDLTVLNVGSPDNQQANGTGYEWALESQFARLNYSLANRYLVEGVVRRDGSSRFPTANKYALFPSIAVGWRIGQEKFISDNFTWIDELKLKASRGALGNQAIGNYPYQTTLGVVGAAPRSNIGTNYSFGGSISQGVASTVLVNPNLKWETTRTTDAGIEFSILGQKLSGSATYFHRYSYDILYSPTASVSNVLGLALSVQNTGRLKNTGWEFTLNHQQQHGKFSYRISSNLSVIRNKVLSLGVGNVDQPNGLVGNGSSLFIGYPMNLYYGFMTDGLFTDQADIDGWADMTAIAPQSRPGDIRYKDISGPEGVPDGKVDNTYDRTVLGSSIPKYTYGVNLGFQYAGFDLSIFLQGIGGVNGYLSGNQGYAFNNGANIQRWQYDERWSEANPDRYASYPRLEVITNAGTNNTLTSSFWMLDGSYLRIKNVQFGYTIKPQWLAKARISNLRLYFSGENLYTFSNYRKGWDPEISGSGTYYPIIANYTLGINLTF